jgi:hypothetical protein
MHQSFAAHAIAKMLNRPSGMPALFCNRLHHKALPHFIRAFARIQVLD